ncbi:hypothetical protein KIPB_009733 [Kipferlia bialata]|uniref:Uncharacterized protein n=1 Tax=Kipferlia bialata TaxID=797122 RepID=A0A391NRQ9_9EUKA|nr:hypothetical protein KIPB_009733 [Kipferlia bialata]|eukprot:g9733.t1
MWRHLLQKREMQSVRQVSTVKRSVSDAPVGKKTAACAGVSSASENTHVVHKKCAPSSPPREPGSKRAVAAQTKPTAMSEADRARAVELYQENAFLSEVGIPIF